MNRLDWSGVVSPHDPPLPDAINTESGLRTRNVDELRSFLTPYLSDYGITRVAHLTGFDSVGLPVHMAVKPQGKTLSSGSGKGSLPNASWVSAVMECAEQAVWENISIESINTSENTMRRLGVNVVEGNSLPLMEGELLSEDLPIGWVAGWDIVSGEEIYVPEALVTVAGGWQRTHQLHVSGSNGLASGAHVLEAVLSGLQEVIERDGVTLNTEVIPAPHQDAMQLLEEAAPSVAERVQQSGLRMEVADCTTDVGVPTLTAYLFDDLYPTGTYKGAGAATSYSTALVRAVTEAAQARCLIVAGARDDIFEMSRASSLGSNSTPKSAGAPPIPQREIFHNDFNAGVTSVLAAIEWMIAKLQEAGFNRVIVIRHSAPGDPVQVVRVIVPGAEGYPFAHAKTGARADAWRASQKVQKVVSS